MVWLFLVFFGLLFTWNSWKRDFWEPDEPYNAEVAREMEQGGDGIVPTFAGEPRLVTPPLGWWLPAALHRATGIDERWSYRFPSTLAAVLGLWITFAAGKRLFNGRIAFLAVVLQASTYLYFRQASWVAVDLLFSVCCQAALMSFALAGRKGSSFVWSLAGWIGLAGATLSKSLLLALALIFLPLALFFFLEGGTDRLRRGLRPVRRSAGWLIFLALVVPWFAAAFWRQGTHLLTAQFLEGHLARLWDSPVDARPPYEYFIVLLWGFLPWSLFVPLGLLHGKDRMERNGERLAFIWSISNLILLSCVSAKRPGYLLVIWPALSLLISAAFFEVKESFSIWEDFLREGIFGFVPWLMRLPALLVVVLGAAYATGLLEKALGEDYSTIFPDLTAALGFFGLAAAAAAISYAASYRVARFVRQRETPRAAYEVACVALFCFFAAGYLNDGLGAGFSSRPTLDRFATHLTADSTLATYGERRPAVLYYLGRDRVIEHFAYADASSANDTVPARLEAYLKQSRPAFLVLTKSELERLQALFPTLRPYLHVKDRARSYTGEEYVLVGNR